ncbi:unnamed protein product [Leptosia nina]|uniref:Uncharacterized protein n=1 Tax=Leptosia nina TaxID=320188 RepID=A0AAV1J0Q9_9NEOP
MGTIKQRGTLVARSGETHPRVVRIRTNQTTVWAVTLRPPPPLFLPWLSLEDERDAASPRTVHIDHDHRFALSRGRLLSERRGRADGDGTEHDVRSAGERCTISQRAGHSTVEFKSAACAGASETPAPPLTALPDPQQFNIFPAFFSRQLNFNNPGSQGAKIMEELRPNLVGGLLGVPGLLDEHQHDAKFLPSGAESKYTPDKGRKCSNASSSSAEEFGGLYGGEHAATPPAPPISRSLQDHTGTVYTSKVIIHLMLYST